MASIYPATCSPSYKDGDGAPAESTQAALIPFASLACLTDHGSVMASLSYFYYLMVSLSFHQIVNVLKFPWIITVIVTPYGLSLYTSLWNIFLVSPIGLLPLGFISLDPFYRYGNIWRLGQGIFIKLLSLFLAINSTLEWASHSVWSRKPRLAPQLCPGPLGGSRC